MRGPLHLVGGDGVYKQQQALKRVDRVDFFGRERQSLLSFVKMRGEESPDFTGEDTSETLGAARLRKVQQKINRWSNPGRMKILDFRSLSILEETQDGVNPIRSKTRKRRCAPQTPFR